MHKRISILLMLALIISIGGVYATWGYAEGAVVNGLGGLNPGKFSEGNNIFLAEADDDTKAGIIEIDASTAKITIDDLSGDHVAELYYEGQIKITFEPSNGAAIEVVESGIDMKLAVSCTANWEYDGRAIFSVAPGSEVISLPAKTVDPLTGKQTYIFEAEDWQDWFIFNEGAPLTLVDLGEYDAFHTELHLGKINLTVSDAR